MFSEEQIGFINYLSGLLPLVRVHEYQIVRQLLLGSRTYSELDKVLRDEVSEYNTKELDHSLVYMKYISREEGCIRLNVELDEQIVEYVEDLIEYGLIRYTIDNGDKTGFKLWLNYRMDQVQMKLLKNPSSNQVGTYYYDDYLVIFASLKKDLDESDKLNYKDKFLEPGLFQWESMTNLPQSQLEKLKSSSYAHLFIRKVSEENGIVLPFTYVGKGHLENPRKTEGDKGTYLFDIHMENELPDYLQFDFGLTDK